MYDQLIKYISTKHQCKQEDIDLCITLFQPLVAPKNKILEDIEKVPQYLYYIVSGYMRLFYYNDNGDEVTTHINCPHGFFTSFAEFSNQTKAKANVQAVTECNLLRITKLDYDVLMEKSPFWKNYGMEVLQDAMSYNEERSKDLMTLSAEQRYSKLINDQPDIILNVPLQYIASFLGIKPESLSRIRRKLIT